jgi:hypothetical protein
MEWSYGVELWSLLQAGSIMMLVAQGDWLHVTSSEMEAQLSRV